MNTNEVHPIQSKILCELLFVKEATFSELNKKKLGSDLFSFHLRQLSDWKLIEKSDNGKYKLTTKGKEFANRFDTKAAEIERQPKIGVLVVTTTKDEGKNQYLIQQRLKQPYYGYWGFITGKIRWGETAEEAALRELKEETGLCGKVKLLGLKHKMDYDEKNSLLEDKFFLVFKVSDIKGQFIQKFEGGENHWMDREEVEKLENLFDGVLDNIDLINGREMRFIENKYRVKGY